MTKRIGALAAAILALATSAACTVQQADSAPPLTGPSGFSQDITVTATPDVLTRDGFSQSAIVVRVFGPNGQPVSAVPVRVDILDSTGTPVDFGTLSTKSIVTGSDGRATTVYTAPLPPPPTAGGFTTVATIRAMALGSDALNSKSFTAEIRLVPPGVILPPALTPQPCMVLSPQQLTASQTVQFTAGRVSGTACATSPSDVSDIVSFTWNFGDGTTGSGRSVSHVFSTANTFNVTLTETSDRGLSASVTQAIPIGSAALPVPSFTFSPQNPAVGENVFFNGSTSVAGAGHTIVSYDWTFGDGGTATGVTVSHAYTVPGTYRVQLRVTDEAGQSVTSAETSVTVGGSQLPVARFTVSPGRVAIGEPVLFVASMSSEAQVGQPIVAYLWNFGDDQNCPVVPIGTPPTCYVQTGSPTITHSYSRPNTFRVNLVVRDSAGRISLPATDQVAVGTATAQFTFTPASPAAGSTVSFDGSRTTPSPGAAITSYQWDFGDGTTANGATTTHVYPAPGTYTVRLTVLDSAAQSSSITQSVTVR